MVDTNRPAFFEVIDTQESVVVAVCASHAAALAVCNDLEPDDREYCGGWRYIIEPMRPHTPHVSQPE
ncbi:hypothetical protein GA0061099_102147 [Bradyrhizobium yuanmingense]|uniref:Uncharacterized protein n=1 Tax=Bradyrhizobium yuanmingense TaxID=108015 RepID=A0A1C3XHL1_9BRAD|nr:hypothetical protein [Bradyrhizobium yuanmingense]TWI18946.1 hypothetical protein IQ15_06970 [Bradyrhizobium yuanmingense]SCB51777.1 hypothetical protein GA0061099_102147 [Bradyrhizobium yuanmingense]